MRRALITDRARAMRKAMTEPEVMLWSRLHGRGPDKPTFRGQHPFGSIILDFYCPAARLALEVDGATHWDDEARAKDEARDRWLMSQGVRVHRIPAGRIYHDLGGVTGGVLLYAQALKPRGTFSRSACSHEMRSLMTPRTWLPVGLTCHGNSGGRSSRRSPTASLSEGTAWRFRSSKSLSEMTANWVPGLWVPACAGMNGRGGACPRVSARVRGSQPPAAPEPVGAASEAG